MVARPEHWGKGAASRGLADVVRNVLGPAVGGMTWRGERMGIGGCMDGDGSGVGANLSGVQAGGRECARAAACIRRLYAAWMDEAMPIHAASCHTLDFAMIPATISGDLTRPGCTCTYMS